MITDVKVHTFYGFLYHFAHKSVLQYVLQRKTFVSTDFWSCCIFSFFYIYFITLSIIWSSTLYSDLAREFVKKHVLTKPRLKLDWGKMNERALMDLYVYCIENCYQLYEDKENFCTYIRTDGTQWRRYFPVSVIFCVKTLSHFY